MRGTFRVLTSPVSGDVRLTYQSINHIVEEHDDLRDAIDAVILTVNDPDEVRRRSSDPSKALHIRRVDNPRLGAPTVSVVVIDSATISSGPFVVTAHSAGEQTLRRLRRRSEMVWQRETTLRSP